MTWSTDSNGRVTADLEAKASVATGTALDIRRLKAGAAVKIKGTFTATIVVKASLDGGTSYDEITTFTAAGHVILEAAYDHVLLDTTAYTSGTPVAVVVGESR